MNTSPLPQVYTSYPVKPEDYESPHIVSEAAIRRAIANAIGLEGTDPELFGLIGLSDETWFGPIPGKEGGLTEGEWYVDGPTIGILVTEVAE